MCFCIRNLGTRGELQSYKAWTQYSSVPVPLQKHEKMRKRSSCIGSSEARPLVPRPRGPLINENIKQVLPLFFVFIFLFLPLINGIMYLKREIDRNLLEWKLDPFRKPLLVRGARQVGKSSTVRELARHFDFFLEINFEEQKQVHSLFSGDLSPETLCENLSIFYNTPVIPGKTLVFFDEIQSCLPAISSLRKIHCLKPCIRN